MLTSKIEPLSKKSTKRRGPSPDAYQLIGDTLATLHGRIAHAKDSLGWDWKTLAERAGLDASTLTRLRDAEGVNLWTVVAIARAMDVRLGWLLDGEHPMLRSESRRSIPPSPHRITVDDEVTGGEDGGEDDRPSGSTPVAGHGR